MTIYLDHAATAYPRHPRVGEAMLEALNVAGSLRGSHGGAAKAGSYVERCRAALGGLFGIDDPSRWVLYPSATTALNTVIADAFPSGSPGDRELWIGPLEHNAIWRSGVRRVGRDAIVRLPAHPTGEIDIAALDALDTERAAIVIVQHASNVSGVVQDIERIGAWCAERGLRFVVDGAQAAGLVPSDLSRIPALVAYTMAGHKYLGGPPGVGVAYYAAGFDPEPLWVGGNGVDSGNVEVPACGPPRYESGTANLPGIAGLAVAVEMLLEDDAETRWQRALSLRRRWQHGIASIAGVRTVGDGGARPRTPVISFTIDGHQPAELADRLDRELGVRCRPGLHCAPLAHEFYGTAPVGTLRFAPGDAVSGRDRERVFDWLAALRG